MAEAELPAHCQVPLALRDGSALFRLHSLHAGFSPKGSGIIPHRQGPSVAFPISGPVNLGEPRKGRLPLAKVPSAASMRWEEAGT